VCLPQTRSTSPRFVTIAATFALGACATKLQVVGPYAGQLSQSDIQQMTALITPSSYVSHLYTRLEALHPDEVHVKYRGLSSGLKGVYISDPSGEYFTACKRDGKWVTGNEAGLEATITVYGLQPT
jgi:hypothetical protein